MEVDDTLRTAVEHVYDLLVRGEYDSIVALSGGVRLSATEIQGAVRSYPYRLRHWPVSQRPSIDAIEIKGSYLPAWSVRMDAYTTDEGRSDLTLELTVTRTETGTYRVEFDDLHVL